MFGRCHGWDTVDPVVVTVKVSVRGVSFLHLFVFQFSNLRLIYACQRVLGAIMLFGRMGESIE